MRIELNGKDYEIAGEATVSALIEELELQNQACAVEVNKKLVRKAEHAEHALTEGDRVEIVTLVGGG